MDKAEIYESILDREFERLFEAFEDTEKEVTDRIIEKGEGVEALKKKQGYLSLAKNGLKALKLIFGKLDSLFEESNGRRNWEVYLSGLRMIARKFPQSYFAKTVLTIFKLDEAGKKLFAYCDQLRDFMGKAQQVIAEAEKYVLNLEKGLMIQESYSADAESMRRLYASLKTWTNEEKLEKFMQRYESLVGEAFKVIVIGPIQLYLILSPETFLMVFKLLTAGKLRDLTEKNRDYDDIMALHELIHSLAENSEALDALQEIFSLMAGKYLQSLKKEQREMRSLLPQQKSKIKFVRTFESGGIFTKDESH